MCGIIGYVGFRNAVPILIGGLKKLEYRGYDSSGVSVLSPENDIIVRKSKGKIANLEELILQKPIVHSTLGISHTRWATHGEPNHINSHPHTDCSQSIVVVHNGIIENYESLKAQLQAKGHKFVSQTDTEVIAHLIEEYYKGDLFAAVKKTILDLKGAFALGIISKNHPDLLIAARVGSPLIIGLGKGENFIASDVPAILDRTKKIIYLQDGEMACISKKEVKVFKFSGEKVIPKAQIVKFSVDAVKKQGFAHFMLKEMHEQPHVISEMGKRYIKNGKVDLGDFGLTPAQIKAITRIDIVACGTAYHAGMVGKYAIEKMAKIPVTIDVSSEFRYRDPIVDKNTMIIAISQSGETADTLAAVKEAKRKGAKIVSICNVLGSSLVRESDAVLYTHAGPEIGVASTKAYTAQLGVLFMLAVKLATVNKTMSPGEIKEFLDAFKKIPTSIQAFLADQKTVARVAKRNSHFGCFLFLGRNINFPSALEGALKLKEISYIPAEGYAAGEMKHGPIALIDEYRAVVCIAPASDVYEKIISNMQEIRARKGKIIAIATEGDQDIKNHADDVLYIAATHDLLTPLLAALPLQLIAYHIAVQLGCDVDQPRNLAKSVTVE
ncbi:MAG: glutamine--fructose-6-phosphate transaminase (isomerizing) [Candidatus Omnitrophica bacterium]|nr:glutamine--fructose-6-phosphate transaminase (isomerizing) [Candidatus Omnitrophota bacterium]